MADVILDGNVIRCRGCGKGIGGPLSIIGFEDNNKSYKGPTIFVGGTPSSGIILKTKKVLPLLNYEIILK